VDAIGDSLEQMFEELPRGLAIRLFVSGVPTSPCWVDLLLKFILAPCVGAGFSVLVDAPDTVES
jgi:hypothetical protein